MSAWRRVLVLGWLLLAIGLFATGVSAQRYHSQTYTPADGLPAAAIGSIVQAGDGCIWFSTRVGATCYDGARWTTHRFESNSPLGVFHLAVDRDGRPIIVNSKFDGVVHRYDEGSWQAIGDSRGSGSDTVAVLTCHEGENEIIVVGTTDRLSFHRDDLGWQDIQLTQEQRGVWGLAEGDGGVHILTRTGLLFLHAETTELERLQWEGVPQSAILNFAVDRDEERIWLAGEDWIGVVDRGRFTLLERDVARDFSVRHGFPVGGTCSGNGFFFGDRAALWYYDRDAETVERLGRSSGLITEGATSILRDRENNIWIGSRRGVTKVVDRSIASYSKEHGLFSDEVTSVLELDDGRFLLGHDGGLSIMHHPERGIAPTQLALSDVPVEARVMALEHGSDGRVWIAAHRYGLAWLDSDGTLSHHEGTDEWGEKTGIMGVLEDESGRVWVATNRGVFRSEQMEPLAFERVVLDAQRSNPPVVRRLQQNADGSFHIALYRDGVIHMSSDDRILDRTCRGEGVFDVHEIADGSMWYGTDAGLRANLDGRLANVELGGQTIDQPVYFILEDAARIWFGTEAGIVSWDREALERFTVEDGLIGNETNRDAGLIDSHGCLWVGSDRGVSICSLGRRLPRVAPSLELISAEVYGEVHRLDEPLALAHDSNTINVRFRAIGFRDERRMRFRSRLVGFDDEWSAPTTLPNREIRYTKLPPGSYRFEMMAIDSAGNRSVPIASDRIDIALPFHRTQLFLLAVLLAAATAAAVIVALIGQRRYSRRLEVDVAKRTSELRASEEELAHQHEQLVVTLASVTECVVATDCEGRVALWNRAAEVLTGIAASDAAGRSVEEFLRTTDGAQGLELAHQVVSSGKSVSAEGTVQALVVEADRREDSNNSASDRGITRQIEATGAPIHAKDGTITGAVVAFRDVTDRRRREEEELQTKKLEAIGILAGGIAHDFNNALAGIVGALSILATSERDVTDANTIDGALASARRARSLTRQLVTFADGGAPVQCEVNLEEVIGDAIAAVVAGSGIRCEVDLAEDLSPVSIDRGQMEQVFQHLLRNAREAMSDEGVIKIRASNHNVAQEDAASGGECVRIEIEDGGEGIAKEILDRIFDPYFTTRNRGGGLGLAVTHSIVSRHGGRISVDSVCGAGSVFAIELPPLLVDVPHEADAHVGAQRTAVMGRILVMDDDPLVSEILTAMLERLGYESAVARNGEEAISRYESAMQAGRRFDGVIMDLTISNGMGGRQAVSALAAMDPSVRAVVASGYSTDLVMAEYEAHGFVGRLEKPFVLAELDQVLTRLVDPVIS